MPTIRTRGLQLVIGTYTERLPGVDGKADGILTAGFDPASGRIGPVTTAAAPRNPSYLTVSGTGENLYAVSETLDFEGGPGGGVTAYARDPRTGELTELNTAPSLGNLPCHVTLDGTGRFVLIANYGTDAASVTVYRVNPDGSLGARTDHVTPTGSGPDPDRQANSHAHMTATDPVTGAVLVADLGGDVVLRYTLDAAGRLHPRDPARLAAVPGAGPRHLAFHPGGRHLLVINELDSTVDVLHREGDSFSRTDRGSTLPVGLDVKNGAAAIQVTPSGRHVLATNRGQDGIAVFRFDPATSSLKPLGHAASPGKSPRDLTVTPDGRHVITACQDSDLLATYEFDDDTGQLTLLATTPAPTPVCVAFAPLDTQF
jgi:6-phosphogluconolactonase